MARKKSKIRRKAVEKKIEIKDPDIENKPVKKSLYSYLTLRNIMLILVLVILIAVWKFKGYFIVATVNGQPITRFELSNRLYNRFSDQTLDDIISEKLILAASRQDGVFVSSEEIDARIKQIEDRLQGQTTLEEALKFQGLTPSSFRQQIEIQIAIEKLFDQKATVSAENIDEFIEENRETYSEATDPAKLRENVREILRQGKTTELFDPWFSEIRKSARIKKYL